MSPEELQKFIAETISKDNGDYNHIHNLNLIDSIIQNNKEQFKD